jgi:hypothetical protein
MALHDDLLEQAQHLASREPRRLRQASLRRAVSVAYYALFHLLAAEGVRRFLPASPVHLREQVRRSYEHGHMKTVCDQFSKPQPSGAFAALLTLPIEPELCSVAEAFIALQQARHDADYNLTATFNRIEVLQQVKRTRQVFADWRTIRSSENATVFLAALLFQRHRG